jgi:hypothetical protein
VDAEEILTALNRELEEKVVEVEGMIQDAGIKAVEVLIEKVENEEVGEDVLTKEEVEETINRKLDMVVLGVAELDVEIGETSELMVTSTDLSFDNIIEEDGVIIETNVRVGEDGVAEVIVEEPSAAEKVEVAEQKVEETNKKAEEIIVEVESFIEQDNLSAALEKVKELGMVENETKVIVTEASDAVNEVVETNVRVGEDGTIEVVAEETVQSSSSTVVDAVVDNSEAETL